MATRRSLQVLRGVGEGVSDVGNLLTKLFLQDQMQSRVDARQLAGAKATLDRQHEINVDELLANLLKEGATNGNVDPEQIATIASALGRSADTSELEKALPARRRLETTIGKQIGDAKSAEDVPSDQDVIGMARARGVNDMLPADMLVSDATTDAPFINSPPAVAELGARAGAKRRELMEKPTNVATRTTSTGAEETVPFSLYGGPVGTKPDAETQGVIKGTEELGTLNTVGDARAAQKGKEKQAEQDVEMAPAAVDARVAEAARKEAATMSAALPFQIKKAQQEALIQVSTSLDKEHRSAAATAATAAGELQGFFNKVSKLTQDINKFEGPMSRVAGGFQRGQQLMGANPKLTELDQLVNQNLRRVAIAMGVREANVSEKETAQALKAMGIGSALNSASERRTGLRNLYDLITIAPVVAAQTTATTPIGERMSLAQSLMDQRRSAEAAAIKAGFDQYIDPVTKSITAVIK